MLFTYYSSPILPRVIENVGQAPDAFKTLEVVNSVVQTVHTVLMLGQARHDGGSTR